MYKLLHEKFGGTKMSYTEPIRNPKELKRFVDYYKIQQDQPRNYCLIILGLNTALRISDILKLTWNDVIDFENNTLLSRITIIETKTGKTQSIAINTALKKALIELKNTQPDILPEHYLFSSLDKPFEHISRVQAYRIIKVAANNTLNDSCHISCHSLRKTFGYFAYKNGANPALLMSIYNHSSFEITKRYLGINQDEKDNVYLSLKFDF